jgi:hypothetical protein
MEQQPAPDASRPMPDARLKGYGEVCSATSECESGLCIGTTVGRCSRYCSINEANPCKDVDAFCAPFNGGGHVCYGTIETLDDLDDAILSVGDSVTRSVTPLTDADLFQVRLNQLGEIRIAATPSQSIDVRLEAYSMTGQPIGIANDMGPTGVETLFTNVSEVDTFVWMVVRNVGNTTGAYTISVTRSTAATGKALPSAGASLSAVE